MNWMEENGFERVLARMLAQVPDDIDQREGSVVYDALAPAALEIAVLYSWLEYLYDQSFASSADREYLEKLIAPWITPYPATKARIKAEFKNSDEERIDVAIGARFNLEKLNFVAIKKLEDGIFELECEEAGIVGNVTEGELIPIEYIENLAKAKILSLTQRAFEVEETEHLRERFLKKVREPATSGNIYHYTRWALEVEGVGAVKVFPLHAGAGTVKVLIINAEKEVADSGLIEKVRQHIEKVRPIGATVTVATASPKNITVSARVSKIQGAVLEGLKNDFQKALKSYFKEITFKENYLSYAKVGNVLLQVAEVLDYTDLRINGGSGNISIGAEEIPTLSELNIEEIL